MNSQSARLITAAVGLTMLAACGTGPGGTGPGAGGQASGSASSSSVVAWIQCVRTHGIPDFPGPDSSGQIPKIVSGQQVGVSDSVLQAAQTACQGLWPYQDPTRAQERLDLADALTFAHCMRSAGVPGFPDPVTDPNSGRAEFVISISKDGFDPQSPQVLAKVRECEHGLPASVLPGSPDGVEVSTSP